MAFMTGGRKPSLLTMPELAERAESSLRAWRLALPALLSRYGISAIGREKGISDNYQQASKQRDESRAENLIEKKKALVRVLPSDMVDKSTSSPRTYLGPVLDDFAVQEGLYFLE